MKQPIDWAALRTDFLYDVVGTVTADFTILVESVENSRFQQWHKNLVNDFIEFSHVCAHELACYQSSVLARNAH